MKQTNKIINKINDKLGRMTQYVLLLAFECIYASFCYQFNTTKEYLEQLMLDEKRLNDKDFEEEYGFTKGYCTSDNFILELRIHTDFIGKIVAELRDLTEEQLASVGLNYTTFGYEIAKIYINDPDFHAGEYDPQANQIRFSNINYSERKMSRVTMCVEDNNYFLYDV